MSIVTIQLGQCGNQIGHEFFETVSSDAYNKCDSIKKNDNEIYLQKVLDRFFVQQDKTRPKARAVLIDMEQKVVSQTFTQAKASKWWRYDEKRIFCHKRGCSNNWAQGFCEYGVQDKDYILDLITKEVEQCDYLSGFIIVMSLAGGTGSGVGASITEALRDKFPHSTVFNQVIWPYSSGEVTVQNYNCILTLAHLSQFSDAILILENDGLHKICTKLLNMKNISFANINQLLSHQLCSILQPALGHHNFSTHLGDLVQQLVPHPDYKLLSLQSVPQISQNILDFTSYSWFGLLKHLRQMLIAKSSSEEGIDWKVTISPDEAYYSKHNKTISNLLLLRGKDIASANYKPFMESALYPSWVPSDYRCAMWYNNRPFNKFEKVASLVSNSQHFTEVLNNVVSKAWTMFSAKAYIHQYLKYSLTHEDFMESFSCLEQIIKNYKEL